MTVLTPTQMYKLDNDTMNNFGIPSRVLMENAGKGCSDFILNQYSKSQEITILCGVGNNGGDGFVIARWLHDFGKKVHIIVVGNKSKMSSETKANFELCEKLELNIYNYTILDHFIQNIISSCDLIIDALFGIGFKETIREPIYSLIQFCNTQNICRVSIDIASGLNAETGLTNFAFQATKTLSIAALKTGQLLGQGKRFSGETHVVPIGIPATYFQDLPYRINTLNTLVLPSRNASTHKTNYGKIGIIAGSKGFGGAAIMASTAALRSGAGLVTLIYPEDIHLEISSRSLEAMQKPLRNEHMIDDLEQAIEALDVILIGPGLGTSTVSMEILSYVMHNWKKTLVIDADAINLLSKNVGLMRFLSKEMILTPHLGEFSRLTGNTVREIQDNIFSKMKLFTSQFPCTLVLKDATTVITNSEETWFNTTGNSGLSTGGSGDILAGLISGFLGQGSSPIMASKLGCYYLGKTAEHLISSRDSRSILPRDILENLFAR
jgi:NAD(P)H-hydrate epimerase